MGSKITCQMVMERIRSLGYPPSSHPFTDHWQYSQIKRFFKNYQDARIQSAQHYNEVHLLIKDDSLDVEEPKHIAPIQIEEDIKKKRVNFRDLFKLARKIKKTENSLNDTPTYRSVEIPTDKAVILVCSADWHLNSLSTDYDEMEKHISSILSSGGVYLAVAGDMTDNMHHFRNKKAGITIKK